jgi:hypothetical protein
MPSISSLIAIQAAESLPMFAVFFGIFLSVSWFFDVGAGAQFLVFILPTWLYSSLSATQIPWLHKDIGAEHYTGKRRIEFIRTFPVFLMQIARDYYAIFAYAVTVDMWIIWVYRQTCLAGPLLKPFYMLSEWLDYAVFVGACPQWLQLFVYAGISAALWFGLFARALSDNELEDFRCSWNRHLVNWWDAAKELDKVRAESK